ncbi:c6 zinc finger domain-containing protein [Thozetella sp. PMI_491]|nr:c6 zinc finger domain-containing protein [Thozetella sp. PMI_491]
MEASSGYRRRPKVGHKKSRNGCKKCKSRRVKVCSLPPISADAPDDSQIPETRERRMMEHRLMQHYIFTMGRPTSVSPSENWSELFSRHIPSLALQYDNLFYSLLTMSATNLLRTEPNNNELFKARQTYLIAAVRAQREMVGRLNPTLADPVCLSSVLLLLHSFAVLSERSLHPYTPPVEWLEMGKGVGQVMWLSLRAVPSEVEPRPHFTLIAANSYPKFEDRSYFDPSMRKDFENILTRGVPSDDDWDDHDTREAYEHALSYVGSIQRAITSGEPVYAVYRRIQTFAVLVPSKFIQLLAEQRPRALVILAHFFGTVAQVQGVWWLGNEDEQREKMATREIRAICETLPAAWQGMMIWPKDKAGIR